MQNFDNDVYSLSLFLSKIIKNRSQLNNILFVYRFSKYIRFVEFKQNDNYFEIAIKTLLHFIKKDASDSILALLLSYITEYSPIFSEQDVIAYFGENVNEIVKKLSAIQTIVDSKAKITASKKQKYFTEFSEHIMSIKASLVVANFQVTNISKMKTYPIKVNDRFIPIFSIYPNIAQFVKNKLTQWLVRQVNKHLQNKPACEPIDITDMLKYYSIISK